MNEVCKEIPGYEGLYEISENGTVYSLNFGKQGKRKALTPVFVNEYYKVKLCKDGIKKRHSIHRLVMLAFVGPSILDVDHENAVKTDNRLENLKYKTVQQNTQNYYNHKNGFCGASWRKRDKKWKATMRIEGKQKTLGYFKTKEEAIDKYNSTFKQLHSNVDA